ncbi:response regulator [Parablastomonas sp. CN1-191]|uniref:hybrid sensor histidine kinase/response regulator n=1 Tax=Parablastomonas sp. CN1-191 TaxID=3400908 RepID=UPI003BF79F8A
MTAAALLRRDWLIVAGAAVLSIAIVALASGSPLVSAAFAGSLLVFGALARTIWRGKIAETPALEVVPDWSVTVAAIDRPDAAVAVADRAGRLVCANARFEEWFGLANAPPRLPVEPDSLDRLARAARAGWRDGAGHAPGLSSPTGRWRAEVTRAGRGEDYLVWHIHEDGFADLASQLVPHITGKLGEVLSLAGFAAALVDPDGHVRAASSGFAQRATGEPAGLLTGEEFVRFLHQDERDRITWARDGEAGGALTLYYLPLADPAAGEPDPDATPALMLLADAGAGIGGGAASGGDGGSGGGGLHLEALIGQLPLGLAMADRDGRLLFANPAFMRAAGREGEPAPIYPTDLVVQEDKGPLSDAIRRYAQGPATRGDIAVRLKAEAEEPVSLSLAGVRGLGEAVVLLGLTDTTEQQRLKRQIAQATKMQAVGQLAGGVAHDFNNVLTAILGTCDLMLLRHTPGDSDYDDIQQIRANSNRAASLTRQLLAFSRQQTLRPEVLQLPDVVSDAMHLLRRLIGEKIEFVVTHDRDLGAVRADPTQLGQVIMNLVVNARDAIQSKGAGGGRITLATRRITAADVRRMGSAIMPQTDYTALIVRDSGTGIAPDNLGKIFEPFFTTKEQGKGTGLGLSTVYGIVKQSNGFIFADSEQGRGTAFSVYLPVYHVQPGELPGARAADADSSWAGGGRVLLVEDEDMVRAVAERALTRAGYTVTPAADGDEGLALVEDGGQFDLIVSDVVMPGMDGPAMVRAIRENSPAIPVLFMSGYAEEQLRKEIGIAGVEFLAKPFSVQQIGDKVGAMLAAERGAGQPGSGSAE